MQHNIEYENTVIDYQYMIMNKDHISTEDHVSKTSWKFLVHISQKHKRMLHNYDL